MNVKSIEAAARAAMRRLRDAVTALQSGPPRRVPEPIPVLVEEPRRR
jgi:hypothetical protein